MTATHIPFKLSQSEQHSGAAIAQEFGFRESHPVAVFNYSREDPRSLCAAQIHAGVYSRSDNKYVGDDQIDSEGVIAPDHDPYAEGSTYFLREGHLENGGEVNVVARQIHSRKKRDGGLAALPTLDEFQCDPRVLTELIGVPDLSSVDPRKVVEISALASDAEGEGDHWEVVRLYSEMIRHSLESGHEAWVMSTDERLTPVLDLMLLGQLKVLGESKEYMGSVSDPRCLSPVDVVDAYLDYQSDQPNEFFDKTREILLSSLENLDARQLPDNLVDKLRAEGVSMSHSSRLERLISRNRAASIAMGALAAYAAVRAVPLATVDEFHGNPAIFAALDIGTIPPYVLGASMMYNNVNSVIKKITGGVIAVTGFLAPYAYVYAEGDSYPTYVNVAVGAFIGGSVLKDAISKRSGQRAATSLHDSIATN